MAAAASGWFAGAGGGAAEPAGGAADDLVAGDSAGVLEALVAGGELAGGGYVHGGVWSELGAFAALGRAGEGGAGAEAGGGDADYGQWRDEEAGGDAGLINRDLDCLRNLFRFAFHFTVGLAALSSLKCKKER